MKHCVKALIEINTSLEIGDVTQEQKDKATNEAVKEALVAALHEGIGEEHNEEISSLQYKISIIRNEIM